MKVNLSHTHQTKFWYLSVTFIWESPPPPPPPHPTHPSPLWASEHSFNTTTGKFGSMCIILLIGTLLICGARQYATRHLARKHYRIVFI